MFCSPIVLKKPRSSSSKYVHTLYYYENYYKYLPASCLLSFWSPDFSFLSSLLSSALFIFFHFLISFVKRYYSQFYILFFENDFFPNLNWLSAEKNHPHFFPPFFLRYFYSTGWLWQTLNLCIKNICFYFYIKGQFKDETAVPND